MRWISECGAVEVVEKAGAMAATLKVDEGELELQLARLDATRLIGQFGHEGSLEIVGVQVLVDLPVLRVTWSRLRPWEPRPAEARQWEAWPVVEGGASS